MKLAIFLLASYAVAIPNPFSWAQLSRWRNEAKIDHPSNPSVRSSRWTFPDDDDSWSAPAQNPRSDRKENKPEVPEAATPKENEGAKPQRKESELVFSRYSETTNDGTYCHEFTRNTPLQEIAPECVNWTVCYVVGVDSKFPCDDELENFGEITAEKLQGLRPSCRQELICDYEKGGKYYAFK